MNSVDNQSLISTAGQETLRRISSGSVRAGWLERANVRSRAQDATRPNRDSKPRRV